MEHHAMTGTMDSTTTGGRVMRRMQRLMTAAVATAAIPMGMLAGCTQVRPVVQEGQDWAVNTASSVFDRKVTDDPIVLEALGPIEVDVINFAGDVLIEVDPDATTATIAMTRRATHGYGRTEEAEYSLSQIDASVGLTGGELGQRLVVRTWTDHAEPHFQRVDMRITVPETEGVYVETRRGRVQARNVAGPIEVTNDEGEIRVMTTRAIDDPVMLINHGGDVVFRVRGESRGFIDAATIRGKVSHHLRYGELRILPGTSHNRLFAELNNGENPIVLRAADGDVMVAVVSSPTTVGALVIP